MTTKVNKVSANEAVINAKANASVLNQILAKVKSDTNGLLKTSLGQKTEIYKKELFNGLSESQTKAMRKKIRNITYSLLSNIVETKEQKLISAFIDFYKSSYKLNDFSFASIASENTKEEKKNVLKQGLQICKENFK